MRTQDFRDANGNGLDDRDETVENRQKPSNTYNGQYNPNISTGYENNRSDVVGGDDAGTPANQSPVSTMQDTIGQLQNGNSAYGQISDNLFNPGDMEDDNFNYMRQAFGLNVAQKEFDTGLSMAQSDFNLGQAKEGMRYSNMLDRQTMQESRNHIFGLQSQMNDQQFGLTDEMANRDYARNIGTMGAVGEQTRKNYKEEGNQQRLGMVTAGEQQRLGYAAQGDQNRQGYRVQGEEQRAGMRVQGQENRSLTRTEGKQQRKNIAATGVENRLQAVTEGEQERLNIGKTSNEERQTMTHSDYIAAGRENRHNKAARGTAMSF